MIVYTRCIDGPFISSSLLSRALNSAVDITSAAYRRCIVIVCPGDTRLSIVQTRFLRDDYIGVYRYLRNICRPRLPEEISRRDLAREREWVLA